MRERCSEKYRMCRLGEKSPYAQTMRTSDAILSLHSTAVQCKMAVWQQCPR